MMIFIQLNDSRAYKFRNSNEYMYIYFTFYFQAMTFYFPKDFFLRLPTYKEYSAHLPYPQPKQKPSQLSKSTKHTLLVKKQRIHIDPFEAPTASPSLKSHIEKNNKSLFLFLMVEKKVIQKQNNSIMGGGGFGHLSKIQTKKYSQILLNLGKPKESFS